MATTVAYHPRQLVSMAWDRAQNMTNNYNGAIAQGFQNAVNAADAKIGGLQTTIGIPTNAGDAGSTGDAGNGLPVIAPVDIPQKAEGASFELFDQNMERIIDKMSRLYADFIKQYFPNKCAYLQHAQQWICDAITKGGTGIHPNIERQIWERERNRQLTDASRQRQDVVRQFAARGFPLPPGAMAAAIERVDEAAMNAIAESSRTTAIEQAKMEVENVRFAVQQAIALYSAAMEAAKGYISAMASGAISPSAQLLPSITDSQAKLIAAAADYYRAEMVGEELLLKERMDLEGRKLQRDMKTADIGLENIKNRTNVALEQARALSTQTAALLNSLHTSATASSGDNTSKSVGYSYGGDVSADVPAITNWIW